MSILLSAGHYFGKEQQFNETALFKLNITAYQPNTHLHDHCHENAYLSLLISGGYEEMAGRHQQAILPGEVLFRPAGYTHANRFHAIPGRCLNIEFKHPGLNELASPQQLPTTLTVYKTGTFQYLYQLLYSFLEDPSGSMSEEYILGWLSDVSAVKIPSRLPWLSKAKAILENEFDTHHTIHSLASRVYVHPIYLARAFREKEGMTPGEYQMEMRVKKALFLLFTTSLPIADIAFAAGFSDASHLVRIFRRHYRSTPYQFRRLLNS
ncbi:helix-turn-helix transcriptional regulator [Chitinophaga polysaccharea]|uniref:helix-turn-helix transcriptional regulator n=1 Tax=Chitinophaga TaxID=79328 RepID=UPI0014559A78|nr:MULTISPECIES: AraC family transcriptional regulator [Chitinophaga]NLR62627.1 helix-turn-helix transcriptional regulator [Chitinophaga polysaccharea]NLU91435.1 helix-turn-helix transcriptional regulator [Chitinophaga sp. Ak27]